MFVTASLLAFRNEIAIYEHGTFKPLLSPDLSELDGAQPRSLRRQTLLQHHRCPPASHQHTGRSLRRASELPKASGCKRACHRWSSGFEGKEARQIHPTYAQPSRLPLEERATLSWPPSNPDELLFDNLPTVFGLPFIPADADTYEKVGLYARHLGTALDELAECQDQLLTELLDFLLESSAETSRLAIAGQAAALENEVINPAVRAFVLTLAKDDVEADTDWIKAVATVVAKKAPAEWTDDELLQFRRELPQQIAAFQRLVALHAVRRADGGGPFSALRVIITHSDGSEHVSLVGIDQNQRHNVG